MPEVDHYLTHRLQLPGSEVPLFEPPAIEVLFQNARGLPRLVNRIAHYALTATALNDARTVNARHLEHAVGAIRLLLLTGCRRNEILTLRRKDVNPEARELNLANSKTGARTVPLSPEVLANIPRVKGNPYVILGKKAGTHMRNLNDPWDLVCERAKIEDARLHDCRHSFASRALALGEGLPMIEKLLGHTQVQTTARYAHLARDSVCESAARISDRSAADILKGYGREEKAPATPAP